MNRIWRQNPLLRICTPLMIGVYMCTDYRFGLFYLCVALVLISVYSFSKKIVWISSAFFFFFIAIGSTWNALIPTKTPNTICPTDWESRNKVINPIAQEITNKLQNHYSSDDTGIIIAFLVGDTTYLSRDLKEQYKNIGISHLLAVSGMHIGLLFGLVFWILKIITRNRIPILSTLIALTSIWTFCSLCQFPPSLNRAAIMFTFLHVGKIFLKKTHAINLLCLSFITQIAWDPESKDNWGLILSHLAVLGIVLFHRPVQLQIKNWRNLPKLIIENITVTIHAQWSTGLFLLPHTANFPTYFLIANVISVPVSSGLLYLLFLLMLIPENWNGSMVHQIVHGWIEVMNGIVIAINRWPMPQINFTDWNVANTLIWLIGGLSLYYIWNRKMKNAIRLTLLGLTLFTFEPYLVPKKEIELHLWRHNGQPCMLYKTPHQNFYMGPSLSHSFLPNTYTPLFIQ